MEEETDFEFFVAIHQSSSDKLRLPDKFAELLDGHEPREVELREAGGGCRLWDVEVVFDGHGHMYLGRGWDAFAREHGVQRGHFLFFSYDGDAMLTVKVFDGTMCRRHYKYDDDDSASIATIKEEDPGSESSSESGSKNSIYTGSKNSIYTGSKNSIAAPEMDIDDAPTSQFTVMLRQCHLGARQKQYLIIPTQNVPVEFQIAHEYLKRSGVVLRMRGKSWPVNLKHGLRPSGIGNPRMSLRYGWHQFCVDNRLDVGDTCFFRALRGGDADRGEDHMFKARWRCAGETAHSRISCRLLDGSPRPRCVSSVILSFRSNRV